MHKKKVREVAGRRLYDFIAAFFEQTQNPQELIHFLTFEKNQRLVRGERFTSPSKTLKFMPFDIDFDQVDPSTFRKAKRTELRVDRCQHDLVIVPGEIQLSTAQRVCCVVAYPAGTFSVRDSLIHQRHVSAIVSFDV